jgi:hypothetical protein
MTINKPINIEFDLKNYIQYSIEYVWSSLYLPHNPHGWDLEDYFYENFQMDKDSLYKKLSFDRSKIIPDIDSPTISITYASKDPNTFLLIHTLDRHYQGDSSPNLIIRFPIEHKEAIDLIIQKMIKPIPTKDPARPIRSYCTFENSISLQDIRQIPWSYDQVGYNPLKTLRQVYGCVIPESESECRRLYP